MTVPNPSTALFTAMEMMGFVFGTALGGLLSMVDVVFMGFRITPFNAPALFSALYDGP